MQSADRRSLTIRRVLECGVDRFVEVYMGKLFVVMFTCVLITASLCQEPSPQYESGTIIKVAPHESAPGERTSDLSRYDVSIKVGDTMYVVLYTPPNGANAVEYAVGIELLVLPGDKTLTFNSGMSGKTEVPIIRREAAVAASGFDPSNPPGRYFSLKLQRLSETLHLNEDQQEKIKPILEQESGELGQISGNPVLSRKYKLSQLEKVVQSSDRKIRPFLSAEQSQKLQEMRKEQKAELKRMIAQANSSK